MEVHFRPQPESQLSEIASQAGRDPEHLVKNAALLLLQRDARYRAGVRKGLEQAERGDFVEKRGIEARIDGMLQSGCASAGRLRPPTISNPSTHPPPSQQTPTSSGANPSNRDGRSFFP
jgi:predicted transcriptional regulator